MPVNRDNSKIEILCKLAQDGDLTAERDLFLCLSDSFRVFAQHKIWNKEEAEEVVQDALLVISEKYKGITFSSSFAGWAHNVLRNTLSSHIKQKGIRARLKPQADNMMSTIVHRFVDEDFRQKILGCLEEVARNNRRFARVINLTYQGFTTVEVCDKLNLRKEYFYVVLARARSMLEFCLGMTKE